MSKQAVLLLNLGSPDSTSIPDVKRYLREFLGDERVIDRPPSPGAGCWSMASLFRFGLKNRRMPMSKSGPTPARR